MRNFLLPAADRRTVPGSNQWPRWSSIAAGLRLAAQATDDPIERSELDQWAAIASVMAESERPSVSSEFSADPTAAPETID